MSQPIDPFNRMPLTLDQVIPQDDLRKEINQWRKDQKKNGDNQPRKRFLYNFESFQGFETGF